MEGLQIRKLVEKHNPEKPALIVASDQGIIQQVSFQTVLNVADEILPFISENITSSNNCIGLLMDKNILLPSIIICLQDLSQSFTFLTPQTLAESCNRLGIKWLLVLDPKPSSNVFTFTQKLRLSIGDELQLWELEGVPEQTKCYENVLCTMQTSGSTGESKAVRIPFECIQKNVTGLNQHFQVTAEDVIYWGTPLTFDPTLIELLLALTFGAPLVIAPKRVQLNPPLLHRALFKVVGISFLQMVPSVFLRFTPEQIGEIFLNSPLKTLALGGEPFPAQLLAFKRHPQLKMYNLYGITELSCWATIANLSTDDSTQEVPLGACLDETFVELRNQEEGLIGEICIGSKSRHCVLDAAPVGSPVPTGDLGEFISGRLYFRGRSSRSIKRFGRRVALQSVEDEIFLNTQLRSRLVYSTTHQRLLAFVVIAQPMDAPTKTRQFSRAKLVVCGLTLRYIWIFRALDKLRVKLLNSLEEHCFPDYLEILTELPLNRHGKICDKSLEGLFKRGPKAGDVGDVFEDLLGGYVRAELQGHRDKTLAQLGVSSISIMQFMRDFQERVGDSRIGELLTLLLNEDVKTCREFVERHLEVSSGETCPVGTIGAAPSPSHVLLGTYIACGSFAHKVAILDESGHELFVIFLRQEIHAEPVFSRCATFLFCPCSNGAMYCLDLRLKKIAWRFPTSDKVSSACLWGTLLAFGSYNGSCYCVSFAGALVWMAPLFGQIKAPPVREANRQRLHVGTTRGWCYALDETDGARIWSCNVEGPVFGAGVVLKDCTVWPSVTGQITCIDSTGCVRWTLKAGGHIFGSLRLHRRSIYFGCHDSYLYKITADDHLERLAQLSGEISSTPVLHEEDGGLFVVSVCNSGSVHVIEAASKATVFTMQLPAQSFSSPCLVKGRLFVGCRDDRLYCIDLENALNVNYLEPRKDH
ncbi:hypothetical protein D910_12773 [Dendroctonus ponderosae]|uniref:AMP-dependent synthetase/ligase domain-containing protein n=1 Tax=Dendroctonus ponderosae TaxID=77166 RepID=U4UYN8_DENPD|nr:hypothetical protein D910_12773 [Dendroctonus ponderosae]